jgi:hypothetical protein
VIELDLAGSAEAIVIEATITNSKGPFTVLVSKTSPYFGVKSNTAVSGAVVSARSQNGKPRYFTEVSPGTYTLEKVSAAVNNWYVVDVECDGVTYSARSYLHEQVPIVDFSISYFDGFGFFDSGYKVNTYIRDPGAIDNYYRLKYYVNGRMVDDKGEISLYSDKLFDGKVIGLGQRSVVFKETDTLIVELQSIDKATYDYFSTLENIAGTDMMQSASPANPISNFSNGALGYFSAYSFDRKTVIIKDYLKK